MWAYIGGKKRLAGMCVFMMLVQRTDSPLVQWTAWLTHTRHHPPTEEVSYLRIGIHSISHRVLRNSLLTWIDNAECSSMPQ